MSELYVSELVEQMKGHAIFKAVTGKREVAVIIESALAAAEARGRQQAEQENAVREKVIENIVYAIEGKPVPHPDFAENGIVKRALRGVQQALETAAAEHEADLFRIKELQASIDGCAQRVQSLAARVQQAEQARNELQQQIDVLRPPADNYNRTLARAEKAEQSVASLTQALKSAREHCICGACSGLDAALTGAQV